MSPEPPAGSTIEYTSDAGSMTYRWRPVSRHPLQRIPVFFGGFMLFAAVAMPISILTEFESKGQPLLRDAIIFGVILLCVGGALLYSGLHIRAQESLRLTDKGFEYDTGPTVLPLPLMLWFGPMFLFGPQMVGGTATTPTHLFRKRHTQSIDRTIQFVLERIGERQRLRVDLGADRLEIGSLLREPEREWLAVQLQNWLLSNRGS